MQEKKFLIQVHLLKKHITVLKLMNKKISSISGLATNSALTAVNKIK